MHWPWCREKLDQRTTSLEGASRVSDNLNDVPESHRDLLYATLTASLTTIDPKGRPRSAAVWYFMDSDGQLKGVTFSNLQQCKDLRRDPNCTLLIIDFTYPLRTLEIRATTELAANPDNSAVRRLADKYGFDAARTPVRANCYTVMYRPRRVVISEDWPKEVLFGNSLDKQ
jgi:PPOX class probable F420-dependent enzyme